MGCLLTYEANLERLLLVSTLSSLRSDLPRQQNAMALIQSGPLSLGLCGHPSNKVSVRSQTSNDTPRALNGDRRLHPVRYPASESDGLYTISNHIPAACGEHEQNHWFDIPVPAGVMQWCLSFWIADVHISVTNEALNFVGVPLGACRYQFFICLLQQIIGTTSKKPRQKLYQVFHGRKFFGAKSPRRKPGATNVECGETKISSTRGTMRDQQKRSVMHYEVNVQEFSELNLWVIHGSETILGNDGILVPLHPGRLQTCWIMTRGYRECKEKEQSLQQYTWIFQVCKMCAFSPKKPTKRQKFYISGRSRYALASGFLHPLE